ncbi:MAG: alpha/beta fold hydrolase [Rhodospirillales bacterium]|nr:alpha/beta fold hydrolase [Rhodospirillales bacterium]
MVDLLRVEPRNSVYRLPGVIGMIAGLALYLPTLAFGAVAEPWNISFPTLGGKQVWQDTHIHAGWRIQRNLLTGHFRLLDPKDLRRAWGSYPRCAGKLDQFRDTGAVTPRNAHVVLLVHGIARSAGTFRHMESALLRAGYAATAITYPSTRGSIADHAAALELILDRLEGAETVSFVTHSMGALVVRHLMARNGRWQRRIQIGRAVMIAPPNQGSEIADRLKGNGLYRGLYGRAGQDLTPEQADTIPPYTHDFGIIAGGTGNQRGLNPLLDGDNDGIVSLDETRLDGAADFLMVPGTHTFLAGRSETITATLSFLRHGKFGAPSENLNGARPGRPEK